MIKNSQKISPKNYKMKKLSISSLAEQEGSFFRHENYKKKLGISSPRARRYLIFILFFSLKKLSNIYESQIL